MLLPLNVHGEETVCLNDLFALLEVTPELAARARARRAAFRLARGPSRSGGDAQTQHHNDLRAYCERAGIRIEDELALLEVPQAAVQALEMPQMAVFEEAFYFITRRAQRVGCRVFTAVITFDLLDEIAGRQMATN